MFLLAALVILSLPNLNITGNVISEIPQEQNILYVFSLAFFLISVFLFLSRQSLDAIVIPTGGGKFESDIRMWSQDKERTEKAISKRDKLKNNGYFLISGYKGEGFEGMRKGQTYSIYKYLRDSGFFPKDIRIEGKSHDTLENVLYTLKKLKEQEEKSGVKKSPLEVAFVSYPDHLKRFKDFEEEALRRGLIKKGDFKFHHIETSENQDEKDYENSPVLRVLHEYRLRRMNRYKTKKGEIKYSSGNDPLISLIRGLRGIYNFVKGK